MMQIYHNSRCGKSRECLILIEKSRKEFEIIKYLEDIPSFSTLNEIIKKLGIKPLELVRQKEKIWIANFKGKPMTDDEIISAMVANPILIERPIVINGEKAVIARPPENAMSIL